MSARMDHNQNNIPEQEPDLDDDVNDLPGLVATTDQFLKQAEQDTEPVAEQEPAEPVQACVPAEQAPESDWKPRGFSLEPTDPITGCPGPDRSVWQWQEPEQEPAELTGVLKQMAVMNIVTDVSGLKEQIVGGHPEDIRQALIVADAISQTIRNIRPELDTDLDEQADYWKPSGWQDFQDDQDVHTWKCH